jgi:threonine dehydrogenase-like Zn-dependent dehydrogenase
MWLSKYHWPERAPDAAAAGELPAAAGATLRRARPQRPGAFQNVIRLMASGQLNLRPMISAAVPLDQAPAAFKRLESCADAKILIQPNGGQ